MPAESSSFAGLRVASFESRRAEEMARMIARCGGVALVSPSMREVPLQRNQAAIDFANRLITGQIDVIIFLTQWRKGGKNCDNNDFHFQGIICFAPLREYS